jgi:hypothetical protein
MSDFLLRFRVSLVQENLFMIRINSFREVKRIGARFRIVSLLFSRQIETQIEMHS